MRPDEIAEIVDAGNHPGRMKCVNRLSNIRTCTRFSPSIPTAGSRLSSLCPAILVITVAKLAIGVAGAAPPATQPVESISGAYRRATFALNLNPVFWPELQRDTRIIERAIRPIDTAVADALLANLDRINGALSRPPTPLAEPERASEDEEAENRGQLTQVDAAKQTFELLTRAVAVLAIERLRALEAQSGDHVERDRVVAGARDAYAAFEPCIEQGDPAAFGRLAEWWRGSAPPSGAGRSSPATTTRVATEMRVGNLAAYLARNYGPTYSALPDQPFAPWPAQSPTFDPAARLPIALPPGSRISKPLPRPRQILNSVSRGARERETPLISLGAAAFNSPFIFGEPARTLGVSCNTCHDKSGNNPQLFIPGLSHQPGSVDVTNSFFSPHANNAVFDSLDIPDLRGVRFSAPYGRNGRFASLREFVRNVITNEFNGREPDPVLLDAIVLYMNEFDFVPNLLMNGDGTLREGANPAVRRGEAIFRRPFPQWSGQSCATCHVPTDHFLDHRRHDVGTVVSATIPAIDGAMDTPTLLGTMMTPPYFHDGSRPTLRSVVEWFNTTKQLGLNAAEIGDLTAYLETIGGGFRGFEPGENFLADDLEDQESFLAAVEFLVERQKWSVLTDLFRGVEREMRRLRASLRNEAGFTVFDKLCELLTQASAAVEQGRNDEALERVKQWRALYQANRDNLR